MWLLKKFEEAFIMKKQVLVVALIVALVALFASCTTFSMDGLAYGDLKGTALGDFSVEVVCTEWLGTSGGANIANITQGAGKEAVAAAVQAEIDALGGTGAINVTVEQKVTAIQFILNRVSGSLYAPETIVVSGTVVK